MSETPYLVAVDDDPQVLRAVGRDLRHKYRSQYHVLSVESPVEALSTVKQLKLRGDVVSLFLVDQRMPMMDGVAFLQESLGVFPDARRVLLTAYADSDAAIRAINDARIDYYLTKPWDPPEEKLFPFLDELLDDWLSTWRPPFKGWRVVGDRWSPQAHALRDFLSRNQVPYEWNDIERDGVPELVEVVANRKLPLLIAPDGDVLETPTIAQVAERLGMPTRPGHEFYDLVIVGGGPAGLAAAVYGASEGLNTVMIEREAPGGQAGTSSRIENYLGFPSGLSGADLARRAVAQATRFGVEILKPREAVRLEADGLYRVVVLDDGTRLNAHAVLISTGLSWRRLDLEGMARLQGAGVYYGASLSEALSCKGEDVYLIGGANSAGQAAMYFSRFARKVTMLVRGPALGVTMSSYLIGQIAQTPNIEVRCRTEVVAVRGDAHLEGITIRNADGTQSDVACSSLYIFIGAQPRTEWLRDVLPLDEHGFVLAGLSLPRDGARTRGWTLERDPYLFETQIPGVFVAGDVRSNSIKRVASAVGEGSVCVQLIHQYLSRVR